MSTVDQEHRRATSDRPGADTRPIDVDQIDADTAWALQIRFDVPNRAAVDRHLLRVRGALNLLVREGLAESNPDARGLYREAYRLLDLHQNFEELTDAQAYEHLRGLARVTRTFAVLCRRR
ncbi:hypothetical protein G6045_06135 [Streptomyces sp. YC504]|uniref:Uncharacterized protein n=1 Tax=Streptomyces mesophilus TaxID=1775132 RepID=A0A6G4XCI4_9ACTN|nr:hypothetical protein [Streptomyces mesophilus]NGO75259.1 hypothetical protein [Streptomyces mesophilus]